MEWFLLTAVTAAIIYGFLTWRFRACLKRRRPLNQESTWVIYLAPVLAFDMFRNAFPNASQTIRITVLVILFALALFASSAVTKFYNRRLEALLHADGTGKSDDEAS